MLKMILRPHLDSAETEMSLIKKKIVVWDFPGGPVVKNPPSKAGDIS